MSEGVNYKMERGYSHSQQYNIIYEWEIDELSTSMELSNSFRKPCILKSPKFSTGSSLGDLWYLQLTMRGEAAVEKDWHKDNLTVDLISDNKRNEIEAKYVIYMLNNKKEKYTTSFEILNHPYSKRVYGYITVITDFKVFDDGYNPSTNYIDILQLFKYKDTLLPNDTLTLCVDLTVYDNRKLSSIAAISLKAPQYHITDDLKELFITKKKSDVVIVVGDEKFQAHKLILGTRSPVFDAMFSHDMKEKKENEIEIPDVDSDVFNKLLEFIYTDEVSDLDDIAEELLGVANKYQMPSLIEMCTVSLSQTINVQNAIRTMLLADRSNVKQLVEYAKTFIAINFMKIKNTKEYEALKTSYPSLYLAILEKYAAGNEV